MPYAAFHDTIVVTKPTLDDLRSLAEKKPPSVTIFEYPFDSLKPLAVLAGLEVLKIQDSGALRTLDGAAALNGIKNLVISTPPTWDGTSRKTEVDSFKPLTSHHIARAADPAERAAEGSRPLADRAHDALERCRHRRRAGIHDRALREVGGRAA